MLRSTRLVLAGAAMLLACLLPAPTRAQPVPPGRAPVVYVPRSGTGYWIAPPNASTANPTRNNWTGPAYITPGGSGLWRPTAGANVSNPRRNSWLRTTVWRAGNEREPRGLWFAPAPETGPSNPRSATWRQVGPANAGMWVCNSQGFGTWRAPAAGPRRPQDNTTWQRE